MAKASKARIAKRAAAKASKVSGRAGKAKTVSGRAGNDGDDKTAIVEKKIVWNANAPMIRAAIEFAVEQETTATTAGVVGTMKRVWDAMHKGQCALDHASEMINAIEDAKHRALKAAHVVKGKRKKVSATRVSEFKSMMDLANFTCVDNLVRRLTEVDVLTPSSLYAVALWMRGPRGNGGKWSRTLSAAPPLNTLLPIVHGANKRRAKDPNGTRSVRNAIADGAIIGFPKKDTSEGASFIERTIKAFIDANPELNKTERPLLAAMLDNAKTLRTSVAKRIRKARVELAKIEAKKAEGK